MTDSKSLPRIPPTVSGIQVNHCKNVHCQNFGVPATEKLPRKKNIGSHETYRIIGRLRQIRVLHCLLCRKNTVIKSNLAIAQELRRLNVQKNRRSVAACTNETCETFGKSQIDNPNLYYAHGKTGVGEARFQCRLCRSTFSSGSSLRKQRRPELNAEVLRLLVNKVAMRRICEILTISPSTLYDKINYLFEVTSQFSNQHEKALQHNHTTLKRAYISVDRQDHALNWGSQFDRRNTMLGAIGAAENVSGYVLAMQLNFDSDLNAEDVEADAIAIGDYGVPPAFREYARVWLRREYGAVSEKMSDGTEQLDLPLISTLDVKAPHSGMQVHLEYLQSALFFHLKNMLAGVDKLRFCVDQDPGMGSACLAAFAQEIQERKVDVFVLKNMKGEQMSTKKHIISMTNREIAKFQKMTGITEHVKSALVLHRLKEFRATVNPDPWFQYPLADMAEPSKAIHYLTDYGDYEIDHLSRLYMRLTMRGIDRYFMQVRRRLSLMERPILTANSKKTWHGYSAYSPLVAKQVLGIFRVFFNYSLAGEDGQTPAQRIGLSDSVITLEELTSEPRRHIY